MNIITGTVRLKEKEKRLALSFIEGKKDKCRNHLLWMGPLLLLWMLISVSCKSGQQVKEEELIAKTDVQVCAPFIGDAEHFLSFHGVTKYMQTNEIRAKLTGIVTGVHCGIAENITVNQALFIVQPMEAAALQKTKIRNQMLTSLSDTIYSHVSGQIKNLNVQTGDFVQSGDILASCVRSNSLRIIVFIPVEQISVIQKVRDCSVILPDGTSVSGRISAKLPVNDANDQTQAYIVETQSALAISENINLMVHVSTGQLQDALFVPERAVLGNEEQNSFWVMKLLNDSVCTKVIVQKGLQKDSMVQVLGSDLTINDWVVSEGGYGLPDSARVSVTNKKDGAGGTQKSAPKIKSTSSRH